MTDHADIDALVERAARRDPDAFRALYEEFAPRLYRFTLFRVRNPAEAEDLVQRVFVKMIETLPRYEQRGLPFGAWVFRLARNAVIDFERTRHPHETLEFVADLIGAGPGPDELAELTAQREELLRAISALTQEQQEVVTLRFFGGLAPAEIGGLMGKREGTIRALQFRAIETLRRQIGGATPETADNHENSAGRRAAGIASSTPATHPLVRVVQTPQPERVLVADAFPTSAVKDGNEAVEDDAASREAVAETLAVTLGDADGGAAPQSAGDDADLVELTPLGVQLLGLEGLEP